MSLIIPANTLSSGGFAVDNSLRFNSGSSDYLNRTPSSAGNRRTWTFSCWIKRGKLGASNIFTVPINGDNKSRLYFYDDKINWVMEVGGTGGDGVIVTNRVFRDTSAWYNLVFVFDTTNGTAGNRMRLYVNGVEETSFSTDINPNENYEGFINDDKQHNLGFDGGSAYADGYFAEVVLIDGTALAPTSFGEFDEDSGIWKPIDVSGLTFGTNGFYLDFENSAALGDDVSGNGNDFTVNNLTAIDQTTDTCTNNFATANPLLHGGTVATLSEGNLKLSTGTSWKHGIPTIGVSSGKWYMEAKIGSMGQYYGGGVIDSYEIDSWGASGSSYAGQKTLSIGYYSSGTKYIGDSSSSYGASYTTGDIVSTAIDLDAGTPTVTFYKNGASQGAVNLPTSSNSTGLWFFMPSLYNGTLELNFGNPTFTGTDQSDGNSRGSFEYEPPSGFLSLCTANLSEVLG